MLVFALPIIQEFCARLINASPFIRSKKKKCNSGPCTVLEKREGACVRLKPVCRQTGL